LRIRYRKEKDNKKIMPFKTEIPIGDSEINFHKKGNNGKKAVRKF